VSANSLSTVRVEANEMMRKAILSVLGMLLLVTPAAAGDRSIASPQFAVAPVARTTTQVVPTSSPFVVATQPFAASSSVGSPLPASVRPGVHDRSRRHHVPIFLGAPAAASPQVIVVQQPVYYVDATPAPSACSPGYWSYRWIPYTTTQAVWVQGSWAADGSWTDSHWESQPYSSGYYEPFWTPGC
jgi:hypothetical protein